ncbi:MAG: NAD(P)/FAD-dependent oxidoreductase [Bdellovibrionia bacterium]
MSQTLTAAIIGSGPAGLMAAEQLSRLGAQRVKVTLFEKRKGLGRKLLVAGSSGLNITYDCPENEFAGFYRGSKSHFQKLFQAFGPKDWLNFIEKDLGIPTFKGTSRRYFVEGMKASILLKNWTDRLKKAGVEIVSGHELLDFDKNEAGLVRLKLSELGEKEFHTVILALGGGSWEPQEKPLRWVELLKRKGLTFTEFQSANCGYEIDWPQKLLEEAEGKPIKNIVLTSPKGKRSGELVITRYGLEGTPIYFAGMTGTVYLDLKPEMTPQELLARLNSGRENLSPIRRVKKHLKLSEGADAFVFHMLPAEARGDLKKLAETLKKFPVTLKQPRPLEEAISSSGGLSFSELDERLMVKKFPGIFAAGEMLDWDAPTGGFLIQASISQGAFVAARAAELLAGYPSGGPRT